MPGSFRLKWYAMLAIGIAFSAGGVGMIATGEQHGWAVFLFFALCAAVAANELWPALLSRRSVQPYVLLQRFPGPVVLKVDRRKSLFLLIGTHGFRRGVCMGCRSGRVRMVRNNPHVGGGCRMRRRRSR